MTKTYLRATLWGLWGDFTLPLCIGVLSWILIVLGAYGISYLFNRILGG